MADHDTSVPPHLDPKSPARHDDYISAVLAELIADDDAARQYRREVVPSVIAAYEAGIIVGRQRMQAELVALLGFGPSR